MRLEENFEKRRITDPYPDDSLRPNASYVKHYCAREMGAGSREYHVAANIWKAYIATVGKPVSAKKGTSDIVCCVRDWNLSASEKEVAKNALHTVPKDVLVSFIRAEDLPMLEKIINGGLTEDEARKPIAAFLTSALKHVYKLSTGELSVNKCEWEAKFWHDAAISIAQAPSSPSEDGEFFGHFLANPPDGGFTK